MTPGEKDAYNIMAQGKPFSGYNLFISMQMKGAGINIKFIIRAASTYKAPVPCSCHIMDRFASPPLIYRHIDFMKGKRPHIPQKWNEAMPRAA